MIRVALPHHLRQLSGVGKEVRLCVSPPITISAVLDALEARFPDLRGALRDRRTQQRRAMVRFFANEEDWSHAASDTLLPQSIRDGDEPLLIIGAMAGG